MNRRTSRIALLTALLLPACCVNPPPPAVPWLTSKGWTVNQHGDDHYTLRKEACTDSDLVDLVSRKGKLRRIELMIPGSSVTDVGMATLGGHAGLLTLDISGSSITNAGLEFAARWPSLEKLDLSSTGIDDAGMQHLATLQQLRSLVLGKCAGIRGPGLRHVKSPGLDRLDLRDTPVDDDGFRQLASKDVLETVILQNTKITDRTLEFLRSFGGLLEVYVHGVPGLSREAIEALKRSDNQPDVITEPIGR